MENVDTRKILDPRIVRIRGAAGDMQKSISRRINSRAWITFRVFHGSFLWASCVQKNNPGCRVEI
jgi:hypothetical protein